MNLTYDELMFTYETCHLAKHYIRQLDKITWRFYNEERTIDIFHDLKPFDIIDNVLENTRDIFIYWT